MKTKLAHLFPAAMLLGSACQSSGAEPSQSLTGSRTSASAESVVSPEAPPQRHGQLVLRVEGLTCEGCAWQIGDVLGKIDGVKHVKSTVADKRVVVTYDPSKIRADAIRKHLDQVGYTSVVLPAPDSKEDASRMP